MPNETGPAWALERHWRFVLGLRDSVSSDIGDDTLQLASRAYPVYVAPHIDVAIAKSANGLAPDTRVWISELCDRPLTIWMDRQESLREKMAHNLAYYYLGFVVGVLDYGEDSETGDMLSVTPVAEIRDDTVLPGQIAYRRACFSQLLWANGDDAANYKYRCKAANFDEEERAILDAQARWVLSALMWLRDRIVAPVSVALERHAGKRMAKTFGLDRSETNVVCLRRFEAPEPQPGSPMVREWSHRWTVRGHTRQLSSGKRVWVRSHTKGPEGLPLLSARQTVFAAVR